ncbi:MAG: hypothetical protein ABI776_06070 [Nocardioidaceae bacterium]
MSQQPPPGWVPPGHPGHAGPPPASPPPGAPGYGSAPSWGAPVHKPGVVALRPLTLGDFYDGAFKTIRSNPGAMVGLSAAVLTVFMVIPVLLTLLVAAFGGLSTNAFTGSGVDPQVSSALGSGVATLASVLGSVFGFFATAVLNGLLVRVVAEAVLGRRTSAGQAWRSTRGRLWPLVGLTLLSALVSLVLLGLPVAVAVVVGFRLGVASAFVVGVPLFVLGVAALVFVQVRWFQLAAPALVLERTGILASVRRAGMLSRGQFWRLFGIQLLTFLVVGVVSQVIAVPLGLLGASGPFLFPGTAGALVLVFSSYLSQVVVGAITTPFTSAVVALQYVDQRIRKEGLDVSLIAASQRPAGPS